MLKELLSAPKKLEMEIMIDSSERHFFFFEDWMEAKVQNAWTTGLQKETPRGYLLEWSEL